MITESTIYWITRLDELKGLCMFLSVALLAITSIALIGSSMLYHDNNITFVRYVKRLYLLAVTGALGIIFTIVMVLIPTTKEMCAIKLIPMVANNERVQGTTDNVMNLLETKTEQWIDETIPVQEED